MTAAAPLLAIGFVNPVLLAGAGLAVIPVIIHLLSRRRFRRIEWGATRFLLEAERENRRRTRFEQWLLLALRCLALVLLALLLARPFAQSDLIASLLASAGRTERILVLDDSASLAHRVSGRADFDALKAAAERLLIWLEREAPGDPLTIYLASMPEDPIVAGAVVKDAGSPDVRERLRRVEPCAMRAGPLRVLRALAERLRAAPAAPARLYVFSDFQRSDWLSQGETGEGAFAALRTTPSRGGTTEAADARPRALRAVLVSSGPAPRPNIAVAGVHLERPQTIAGVPAVVRADVSNHSARPLVGGSLQVRIGDAPLPAAPLETIDAGGRATVKFEVTFPDEGEHVLSIGLEPVDGFAPDDTRRLALRAKAGLAVLLVNGQPSADRSKDEVHLLRNAIAPPGPFSSGVRADVIDPDEIDATDLSAYDAILVCNIAAPGETAVAALDRYVRGGGGLVFCLGDSVGDPDEFNKRLYADGTGLLPLPLEATVETGDARAIGLIRTVDHSVTAMFPAESDTLSEYVRFRRFFRCAEEAPDAATAREAERPTATERTEPAGRAPAQVLARFTDDRRSAALVERRIGRGRVLLFTSTVDLDWNDWARTVDGSYVVTMLELVQYAARRDDTPAEYVGGAPLDVPVLPDLYELRATLKSPAYPDEPAMELTAPAGDVTPGIPVTLRGPAARRLGIYRAELTQRSGGIETRPLAVNLDPLESDLSAATRNELAASLGDIPHEFIDAADEFLSTDAQPRRELWPPLLLLLALVLVAEQTLAWWFGAASTRSTRTRRVQFHTTPTSVVPPHPRPAPPVHAAGEVHVAARDRR